MNWIFTKREKWRAVHKGYDRSELESLDKSTLITLFLYFQEQLEEMNKKLDRMSKLMMENLQAEDEEYNK